MLCTSPLVRLTCSSKASTSGLSWSRVAEYSRVPHPRESRSGRRPENWAKSYHNKCVIVSFDNNFGFTHAAANDRQVQKQSQQCANFIGLWWRKNTTHYATSSEGVERTFHPVNKWLELTVMMDPCKINQVYIKQCAFSLVEWDQATLHIYGASSPLVPVLLTLKLCTWSLFHDACSRDRKLEIAFVPSKDARLYQMILLRIE